MCSTSQKKNARRRKTKVRRGVREADCVRVKKGKRQNSERRIKRQWLIVCLVDILFHPVLEREKRTGKKRSSEAFHFLYFALSHLVSVPNSITLWQIAKHTFPTLIPTFDFEFIPPRSILILCVLYLVCRSVSIIPLPFSRERRSSCVWKR